jgi:hypothetical protein
MDRSQTAPARSHLSPVGDVAHSSDATDHEPCAGGMKAAQESSNQGSTPVQVVGTRMSRHAWRAVREVGARVLHDALAARRGSAAEWARRLGIDASRIADWTGLDLTKSPTIADVLLMERDDALRFLRALVRELAHGGAESDLLAVAHDGVLASSRALADALEALKDRVLTATERAALHAHGATLIHVGEQLQQIAAKGAR